METHLALTASYLAAFTMGLFSSLHCISMCGSIIGTLTLSLKPNIRQNKRTLFPYVLCYNTGRISSYVIAGTLIGLAKTLIIFPLQLDGYRFLQLLSSTVMLGAGFYIAGWFPRFAYIEKAGSRVWKAIEPYGRKLLPVSTKFHAFLFGMIWGWLPCGLVYAALALSATTEDIATSGLTMLAFGLGTLPSVMGVGIMSDVLTKLSRQQRFKQFVGILLVLLALVSAFPWMNPLRLQHF